MSHRLAASAPPPRCSPQGKRQRAFLSLLLISTAWSPVMGCAPTLVDERPDGTEESEEAAGVEVSPGRRGSGALAPRADAQEPAEQEPGDSVEAIEETPGPAEEVPEPVPLTAADLNLGPNWERAPHPITLSNVAKGDPEQTLSDEELLQQAEEDPAWRAADGERYEALIVLQDGTSFGRRGPAPTAPTPDASNDFFNPDPEPEPEEAPPELDPRNRSSAGTSFAIVERGSRARRRSRTTPKRRSVR